MHILVIELQTNVKLGLCFLTQLLTITMEKTRDLLKKIRATKGIFHAKMGSIKGRNGMDLTEAEDIKKRWQECEEELQKKIFMSQITMMV